MRGRDGGSSPFLAIFETEYGWLAQTCLEEHLDIVLGYAVVYRKQFIARRDCGRQALVRLPYHPLQCCLGLGSLMK
ncbi:MAG: hypothetical protein HOG49_10830 [Candidatus Scalindua sp.]|nr:hypothetical protein [Candidatus Scalindua sp.]